MTNTCPHLLKDEDGNVFCAIASVNVYEIKELRRIVGVVQDPLVNFGKPTIPGTGKPANAVASRFFGGDSIAELMEDYGLSQEQVETAIRYMWNRKKGRQR